MTIVDLIRSDVKQKRRTKYAKVKDPYLDP